MQCCTCSNWVHLKCSLLSFSRFRTLGSSHFWSCLSCFFLRFYTYQHCDFLVGLLQLVYLHCSIWPSSANAALAPHPRFQTSYPFSVHFVSSPSAPHHRFMLLAVSLYLLLSLPLPNSLRVLQWNAGGLRARSTKLIHFISSHPVDLIYIQESNLNLSSSFRIPGFSALQFHGTHSRSGIFSTDVADASGGVIIFVKQCLFFSELSTSSLSLLGPYSDYVEVNISLNDSSSLSFLNVYAPRIRSSMKDGRTNFFSPFFPPMWKRKRWIFHASASTEKVPLPLPASSSTSLLTKLVRLKKVFQLGPNCFEK